MKTNHIRIFFILLIIGMVSCTEKINYTDLNIQYNDRLVVDAMITTEKKEQSVLLYHSTDISKSDSSVMESGAIVSISDGDTTLNLTEKQKGVYITNISYAAKVNKTYTLNIKLENGSEYSASSYVYPSMVIDTMYHNLYYGYYRIYVKAHCYGQQGASTIMDFYLNDSLLTKNLKNKVVYAKGGFYENLYSIHTSQLSKDTSYVQICMHSISYQMFQYIEDIKNETLWSTEFFRTTPANVRTNISNGGLGYFSASDVLNKQIVIIKK